MKGKTLLLVEDNPDDEALTLRAFRKSNIGNEVAVTRDGAEALEYLLGADKNVGREVRDLPAAILLDLKLPKIGGLEVLRLLRANERTKLIPAVIFTSSREEQDVVNGFRLGCNSYVRKPVKFEEFADAVRQIGLYWLGLNEPIPK